jgi:hypothetical protein
MKPINKPIKVIKVIPNEFLIENNRRFNLKPKRDMIKYNYKPRKITNHEV